MMLDCDFISCDDKTYSSVAMRTNRFLVLGRDIILNKTTVLVFCYLRISGSCGIVF